MYLGSCVLGTVASAPRYQCPETGVHCDVEIPISDQFINIRLKFMQNLGSKVQYIGCYVKILDMHNYNLSLHRKSLWCSPMERPNEEGVGRAVRLAMVYHAPLPHPCSGSQLSYRLKSPG